MSETTDTLIGPVSTTLTEWIASISSVITLLCVLPLVWLTWKGRAHPAAVTWGIWAPIGMVATIGMALGGAPTAAWLLKGALSAGPLLVFIVAAWRGGSWRTDRWDVTCISFGIAGTCAYVLVYFGALGSVNPATAGLIAVGTAMLVDAVGAWPTWVRAWRNPRGELITTYALALGSVLAVLTILPWPWTWLSASYLIFLATQMTSIIGVLAAGRLRARHRPINVGIEHRKAVIE